MFLAIPEDAIKCLNDETIGRDIANPEVRLHRNFPLFLSDFIFSINYGQSSARCR